METSILSSIKKLLGYDSTQTFFDVDIVIHINTALMRLNQLGIGVRGFKIEDATNTWNEFLGDATTLEGVKTLIYLKVKLVFDPPQNSFTVQALKDSITELEWVLKEINEEVV